MKEPCRPAGEPPVCKELEMLYNRAMDRMIRLGHGRECLRDIIAYQEREIEGYRNEIVLIRAESSKHQTEIQLLRNKNRIMAESTIDENGFWSVRKNDVLILQMKEGHIERNLSEKQKNIQERIGMSVILLDDDVKLIGVEKYTEEVR